MTRNSFTDRESDRIIEMAWEDRTPFEAIEAQFGIGEKQVSEWMRRELGRSSWKRWRKRVHGRKTKHRRLGQSGQIRFKSEAHRQITFNKISKK